MGILDQALTDAAYLAGPASHPEPADSGPASWQPVRHSAQLRPGQPPAGWCVDQIARAFYLAFPLSATWPAFGIVTCAPAASALPDCSLDASTSVHSQHHCSSLLAKAASLHVGLDTCSHLKGRHCCCRKACCDVHMHRHLHLHIHAWPDPTMNSVTSPATCSHKLSKLAHGTSHDQACTCADLLFRVLSQGACPAGPLRASPSWSGSTFRHTLCTWHQAGPCTQP